MYAETTVLDVEQPHFGCGDEQVSIEEFCFYYDVATGKEEKRYGNSYKIVYY